MDLFTLVAKIGLDSQEYEQGIRKAKNDAQTVAQSIGRSSESVKNAAKEAGEGIKNATKGTESATKTTTERNKTLWERMFSAVESNGKSKMESLSAWTLAKAKLLADGIKSAFSKIFDIVKKAIVSSADKEALDSLASQTFGELESAANGALDTISKDTNILAGRLKGVGTSSFMQFRSAGVGAAEAISMMDKYVRLAADGAAAYNISVEDADVRLRSFLRGNVEAGDSIGLQISESTRASKALEVYGKKWSELTEAQKQNLLLNVVDEMYTASGVIGQAAREGHEWETVIGNLNSALYGTDGIMPKIGESFRTNLIPAIEKATAFLTDETIQMRAGMLAASLADATGWVFDGVIDLLDKILAWSSGEEEPSDTAQALFDIASSFGKIASLTFDTVVGFVELLFNGLGSETSKNVESFLKSFSEFVDDPMFQAAATTLMGMAVAWMVMHNPLVLVGSAIGVVVTHWETLEKFIDNPAFQVVATVLAGIASGFIILKAPLVAVAGILATIITHWEDIKRWADKAKTAFTNFINTHVPEGFMSGVTAALETVAGLVSGIQSAWNTFIESLSTKNIPKVFGSIQEGWESGGIAGAASAAWDSAWYNPSNWGKNKNYGAGRSFSTGGAGRSFATGLDYVPYDNFVAKLHAGETVLNRADATAYRAGNVGGISAESISQAVAVAVREALDGVGVYMGADRVGDLVTQRVSRNIAKGARAMRYANV